MSTLRQPISVLVVIYNEHNEFLLLQRADDPSFWQSVTGGIDVGESPLETAYRELKEETGIDAKALGLTIHTHNKTNQYPIRPQWLHRYEPDVTINTEYVFSIQVPSDIPVLLAKDEHISFVWLDKPRACEQVWSPSNRKEIELIGVA
ncbi:dihydroneopterin triphosphate diphosphatase [Pseudoalteromonas piscicida]|uniref:Dihydroneopterin triphosphate diphosphatase n=1 Tax=Pseudoalteromonas piscicida TaxID=43662 RepID=A0A2A5JL11_PSEO7|nr:dihydroneopterin triphosphate diphosphatase [Pseudoalteromonas piscicida]PCK30132.1 dihydroneopterin triphosphate diphosphatase [Pseudoalteromonas piscicida]